MEVRRRRRGGKGVGRESRSLPPFLCNGGDVSGGGDDDDDDDGGGSNVGVSGGVAANGCVGDGVAWL